LILDRYFKVKAKTEELHFLKSLYIYRIRRENIGKVFISSDCCESFIVERKDMAELYSK
jgi:hypothetical protein